MNIYEITYNINGYFFPPNERMTEKSVNKNTRCNVL